MDLLRDKKVLIVGLGLIGGSIARALKQQLPACHVIASGRDPQPLQMALDEGSIDEYALDLSAVARKANIIIIAVPTLTVRAVLQALVPVVSEQTIITDAASVKGSVVEDFRSLFPASYKRFVPGHPIAGSEQSGYQASRAELFRNRKVILTPLTGSDELAVRTVAQLWQRLDAEVHAMSVARHDEVLAATSHLPHLLAYTLVNTLIRSDAEREHGQQIFDYAAGGFADFTRIASSDPLMWRDIFLSNTEASVRVLDAYIEDLSIMRRLLLAGDGESLQTEFGRAKATRDEFMRRFAPSKAVSPVAGQTVNQAGIEGSGVPELAVVLAVLASGVSTIDRVPGTAAMHSLLQMLRQLGVVIAGPENSRIQVYGVGNEGFWMTPQCLQLDSPPATACLLLALLAGHHGSSELTLDAGLWSALSVFVDVLRRMGASIQAEEKPMSAAGIEPCSVRIQISGGALQAADVVLPAACDETLGMAVLLAALQAEGRSRISHPLWSGEANDDERAGTGSTASTGAQVSEISPESLLRAFAASFSGNSKGLEIQGGAPLRAAEINLERAAGGRKRPGEVESTL